MKQANPKHPTLIKLKKLFAEMEKLGLTMTVDSYGRHHVSDDEFPQREFLLRDSDSNENVTVLPPELEYTIVYED